MEKTVLYRKGAKWVKAITGHLKHSNSVTSDMDFDVLKSRIAELCALLEQKWLENTSHIDQTSEKWAKVLDQHKEAMRNVKKEFSIYDNNGIYKGRATFYLEQILVMLDEIIDEIEDLPFAP